MGRGRFGSASLLLIGKMKTQLLPGAVPRRRTGACAGPSSFSSRVFSDPLPHHARATATRSMSERDGVPSVSHALGASARPRPFVSASSSRFSVALRVRFVSPSRGFSSRRHSDFSRGGFPHRRLCCEGRRGPCAALTAMSPVGMKAPPGEPLAARRPT